MEVMASMLRYHPMVFKYLQDNGIYTFESLSQLIRRHETLDQLCIRVCDRNLVLPVFNVLCCWEFMPSISQVFQSKLNQELTVFGWIRQCFDDKKLEHLELSDSLMPIIVYFYSELIINEELEKLMPKKPVHHLDGNGEVETIVHPMDLTRFKKVKKQRKYCWV